MSGAPEPIRAVASSLGTGLSGAIQPELIEATVAEGRAERMGAVAAAMHQLMVAAPTPEGSRDRLLERC